MILKEKERSVIEDLQTQEKSCVEKYGKYAEQARDPELKNLFRNIQQEEQKHYESLSMILSGSVPECNCNDRSGKDYQPKAVYTAMSHRKINNTMRFLQQTVLVQRSWCQEHTMMMYLPLAIVVYASCWLIYRLRSRIMRRCCISIKQ